eukprot:s8753_g1.t1
MAEQHPDFKLDADGNLCNLHRKKTNALLSPEQVASCVKVRILRGVDVDGAPSVQSENYSGETEGMTVNIIGGATGSGKTSLIQILAGGMETDPKLESETKCPTLYILDLEGTQMQMSLGGEALSPFCRFVVTKANADSKVAKVKLAKLPETDFYNALKYSSLGWKVISAGHENLEEIKSILQPTRAVSQGLASEHVRTDVEALQVKQKRADDVQTRLNNLKSQMQLENQSAEKMLELLDGVQGSIDSAVDELASLGMCSGSQKQSLRDRIQKYRRKHAELKSKHRAGKITEDQLRSEVNCFQDQLEKELPEIREMEKLGGPFQALARGVVAMAEAAFGTGGGGPYRGGR